MQEVKRIFNERYKECDINQLSKYQQGKYELGNIASPVVYSVDCIFDRPPRRSGRRCDEFIFFNLKQRSTGIYLIERKDNHSNDVNKVKEQLQGGAGFIEDFLADDRALDNQPFDFMPVWISKGIRPSMRPELKKIRISLRGIPKPISHVKARDRLPELT